MTPDEIFERAHATDGGFCRHYLTLYAVTLGLEPENVFEFGAGNSSKVILSALEQGKGHLYSCDVREFSRVGGVRHPQWTFYHSSSQNVLLWLDNMAFDLVLHDGSHEAPEVKNDIRSILPYMKQNGILLLHDTFHTKYGLMDACEAALEGWPHEKMTLPYGYGLTIIRNLRDTGHGAVSPKWEKNL